MSNQQASLRRLLRLLLVLTPIGIVGTAAARSRSVVVSPLTITAPLRAPIAHPLFENIVLTPEQRHRLDSVRASFGVEAHAILETIRPSGAASREARARHDTLAMKRAVEEEAPQRARLNELLTRERLALREMLMTEQQVVFDRNLAALTAREAKGRAGSW